MTKQKISNKIKFAKTQILLGGGAEASLTRSKVFTIFCYTNYSKIKQLFMNNFISTAFLFL